jgi:hypothetical protein
MSSKMLAKFSGCFLFLFAGFLMLLSPSAGKAQNDSAVNLSGVAWDTVPVVITTSNTDNSVTTLTRYYDFDKQSKVKSTVLISKSAGVEFKYTYNPNNNRYEYRYVPTLPEVNSKVFYGVYKIKGKSLYIDFPDYTVSATIYGDYMKGVLTYRISNKKEEWIIAKMRPKKKRE